MMEHLAFNRWSTAGIKIDDTGLAPYISLDARMVPKTGARYAGNRFYKSKVFIVERFMNKIMVTGHKSKKHFKTSGYFTGKGHLVYNLMESILAEIEAKTKENPIKVLAKAIEFAAPREEIIAIEYGGARYPKAVECAPQRRVDLVLRWMTQGPYHKSFNSKKGIKEAIVEEIINAYHMSASSNAISKKLELERQADASR